MHTTQAELDQMQGYLDFLQVDVRTAQEGAESRHEEDWSSQGSIGTGLAAQEARDDVPGLEEVAPTGSDSQLQTTARSIHVFMKTLPPDTRDRYSTLQKALCEEYLPYNDKASATLSTIGGLQKKHESPQDYYRHL